MQNTLTNTPEWKARFFALYLGCKFELTKDYNLKGSILGINTKDEESIIYTNHGFVNLNNAAVSLRSISSLSETELKELVYRNWPNMRGREKIDYKWARDIAETLLQRSDLADWARSIGVFIPYMGGYQQILDWGWCVLDTGLAVKIQEVEG